MSQTVAIDIPDPPPLCALAPVQLPWTGQGLAQEREFAINLYHYAWPPGTEITFLLMTPGDATDADRDLVRWAFGRWQSQNISLTFREVTSADEATLRIAFDYKARLSNSAIGTANRTLPSSMHTMVFGWSLTATPWGRATALHEIGHAIGLSHEHQHPLAPYIWDEPAVIAAYQAKQNWSESTIRTNIIDKVPISAVGGMTEWDVTSIMHYPFAPGLIKTPPNFWNDGTPTNLELSDRDIAAVQALYPLSPAVSSSLRSGTEQSVALLNGETAAIDLEPSSRGEHVIQLSGGDMQVQLLAHSSNSTAIIGSGDNHGTDKPIAFTAEFQLGTRYSLSLRKAYSPPGEKLILNLKAVQ